MAKGKHATALFEVIHTGKNPPKSSSTGGIATPRWWFKGRKNSKPAAVPKLAVETYQAPPEVVERAVERPLVIDEPAPMRIAEDQPLEVDTTRGEIKFKLSYAGAAAAGFVLIIILAIAYLVGTRSSQVSQLDEFHKVGSPNSGTPSTVTAGLLAAVAPESAAATPELVTNNTPAVEMKSIKPEPEAAPTGSPENAVRQVGLNYIIIQSFPDPAVTQRACDFLNKSGIPCTVVKLPGWSWSSVVSTRGFDHVQHNPDLEDYIQRIETLGETFAGKRQFDRFHPSLKKWQPDQQ